MALVSYAFATEKEIAGVVTALIVIGSIPVINSAIAFAVLLVGLVQFIHYVVAKGIEKRVGKND